MRQPLWIVTLLAILPFAHAADPADEQAVNQTEADFVAAHPGSGVAELENEILLSQSGVGNYAFGEEFGSTQSKISVEQVGMNNAAGAFQANGRNNTAAVSQQGNDNYVTVTQAGDNNLADITQLNDRNRLALDQANGDNSAVIQQNGDSSLLLNQTGGQTANITVQGAALGTITQMSPTLNMTVNGTP